jgi:hypothetical protein
MKTISDGFIGFGGRGGLNTRIDISNKEYSIEFDDKSIEYLHDYLNVICNDLDYNDLVLGDINNKLYEYNKNVDEHIKNNVLIIDKINLKTFRLHLSMLLNAMESDEEYKEFVDEINYLDEFLQNAKELL